MSKVTDEEVSAFSECFLFFFFFFFLNQNFRFSENVNEETDVSDDGQTAETTDMGLIVSSDPMMPGHLYQVSFIVTVFTATSVPIICPSSALSLSPRLC